MIRRRTSTRILVVAGSLALILGFVSGPGSAAAAPPDPSRFTAGPAVEQAGATISTPKTVSGQLAKSDPALLARTDTALVTVMAKLDVDAAAAYAGDVSGLAATSPQITGRTLSKSDPTVAKYLRHVGTQTDAATRAIDAALPAATVTAAFPIAYGGLAVRLPANQARELLKVPGVVAVQQDKAEQTLTDSTPEFIGATKVWPSLGGSRAAGKGVIVGVLDTGIWPEHPSFKDPGVPTPAGGPWGCQFGNGTDPLQGAKFTCNDKLIGAYAFLNTNVAINGVGVGDYCSAAGVCSARDSDGHGTHTSSTAAGSPVKTVPLLGVDRGPISGMAPGASIIMYRVCRPSCYQSDSVAAVQQAIVDGVDVLNFSVGGGGNAYSDPVELAFLDAYAAGISVNASAGNSGPGAATAEHTGPWVTTVGASTSDRHFESDLTLTAPGGESFTKVGSTVTQGVTDTPVVLATAVPGYTGTALCLTAFAAGSVAGQVVLCQRGNNARVEKGYNALQGGAAGMILYNPTRSDVETDNHWLPAIHLEGPNDDLLAFVAAHPDATATWAQGEKTTVQGDVMAGFSSRGPAGDFLKPDITAPGVQVLAGNTPTPTAITAGPPGQLYQAIAGTSMASPHSAGVSALIKAAHPSWTPGQIKSAIMTSSVQDVVKEDGATPADPFDRGAGALRADRAVGAPVTFDVRAGDYLASATDPTGRVDLNLPSVYANPLPGALQTYRQATNVTNATQSFSVKAAGQDGLKISVTPKTFTLAPGATQNLTIVVDGTDATDGWHFGQITLKAKKSKVPAVLPVAAKRGAGGITLTHICDPTELDRREVAQCAVTATNNTPVAARSSIQVRAPNKVDIGDVKPPAGPAAHGLTWLGTLSPSLPPSVTSITPGGSPAGYLPLAGFGFGPIVSAGDETISNFTVPAFQYGGETYTGVGVDSNGYVVIGGGTAQDNDCCSPQTFPDTARPNNVIAPFWTDLSVDPATGGGALRIGQLTDGASSWVVIDFDRVKTFNNDPALSKVNSFEVWIRTGAAESVTMAYGDLEGNVDPLSSGAENRDGTSGANIGPVASSEDYTVNTAPPSAGGSVTLSYEASSRKAGSYGILATLHSETLKGSVTKKVNLTVS